MCRMAQYDTPDTRYIRDWLTHMGWTRAEAARQLGLHYNTFAQYANGHRNGDPKATQELPDVVYLAMECLKRTTVRLDLSQPRSSKPGK